MIAIIGRLVSRAPLSLQMFMYCTKFIRILVNEADQEKDNLEEASAVSLSATNDNDDDDVPAFHHNNDPIIIQNDINISNVMDAR
jgi:hypothetical protein